VYAFPLALLVAHLPLSMHVHGQDRGCNLNRFAALSRLLRFAAMGAWGPRAFENDDAQDWVADLESEGPEAVAAALSAAGVGGYLQVDAGSRAVAAAEVVAAALSRPADYLPDPIVAWARLHGPELAALQTAAIQAMENVQTADSELAELWDEAGGHQWREEQRDLSERLQGRIESKAL
jgi:O-methyltransferase involved in polyketide biosynthesis